VKLFPSGYLIVGTTIKAVGEGAGVSVFDTSVAVGSAVEDAIEDAVGSGSVEVAEGGANVWVG